MNTNKNNHYNKRFKPLARGLRNKSTKAEIRLWCEVLRNKNMLGFTFLRQRAIDQYIADFFCKDLMLVIELDGSSHQGEAAAAKDEQKNRKLQGLGYTVRRVNNEEVMKHIDHVAMCIEYWIRERHADKLPSSP